MQTLSIPGFLNFALYSSRAYSGVEQDVPTRARCFVRVMLLVGPDLSRLLRQEGEFGLSLMGQLLPLSPCARARLLR